MTGNTSNTSSMRSILEKEKLNGENFLNWYKNLRTVLKQEGKLYVLETILPQPPSADSTMAEHYAYKKHENDIVDVAWLIFSSMTPEIQLLHEEKNAFDMIESMKHRYKREIRQERYELSKTLFRRRYSQQKGSVERHVLEMLDYLKRLENLGYPLCQELATDLIIQSLPACLVRYIMDNNLNENDTSLPNLLQTIKDAEKEVIKDSPSTSLITQCSSIKSAIHNVKENTEVINVVGVPLQSGHSLKPTSGENCHQLKDNNKRVTCTSGAKEIQHAS